MTPKNESPIEFRFFQQRYPRLQSTIQLAFARTLESRSSVDKAVFLLGQLALEDFQEIGVLSKNRCGTGALKILRGMYERVVTARWLHFHPEETERFLEFHWVQEHRLVEAMGKTSLKKFLLNNNVKVSKIRSNFERVKKEGLFEVTDCKRCKTKKLNHTWSTRDFVSMAAALGAVGEYIVSAYYIPLRETHPSCAAILSRLQSSENGHLKFDGEGPQLQWAKSALRTAHILLLHTLLLQREHFKLDELEEPLKECVKDFNEIWPEGKA